MNHNRADNTINNLRLVSTSENGMDRMKGQNTSSKYKEVDLQKRDGKRLVRIKLDGKEKWLGYFKNEKQAAAKYNESALNLFGVHALINEISSDEDEEEKEEEEDETDDVQIYT